jgi:hypothetical protein
MLGGHAFLMRGCREVDEENCIASGCFFRIPMDDSYHVSSVIMSSYLPSDGRVCHNPSYMLNVLRS